MTLLLTARSVLAAAPCPTGEAAALADSGRFAEARALLEPCAGRAAEDARIAMTLGRILYAERDYPRAVKLFEQAAAREPTNAQAELWLGRSYGQKAIQATVFEQPRLAVRARKSFEKAVELDPNSLEARFALLEYLLRAPGVLGGSPEKARRQATEIRERDPLEGHRAFGRIAEHEKRYTDAAAEYDRARAEFPERAEPHYWRAALAVSVRDYGRAFDVLEQLLQTKPSESFACYEIGRIASISGERLDRGEQCLKRYLEREPGPEEPSAAEAHLRLGNLYERRREKSLARAEYSEALRLKPGLTDARTALAKLK